MKEPLSCEEKTSRLLPPMDEFKEDMLKASYAVE